MNFLTKINDKLKIIILVVYTLIAVLIAFLVLNSSTKVELLKNYSNVASDDNVKLVVRMREDRKSSYGTSTEFESSTYYFAAYLEKKAEVSKAKLTNIRFFISGTNSSGKISFDEYNSYYTVSNSSAGGPSTTVNHSSNKKFTKTVVVENEKNVVNDTTPVNVYLTVLYTIEKEDKTTSDHKLKYTVELNQIKDIEFSSFESVDLTNNVIKNENNAVDIKVEKLFTSDESKKGSAKYDSITITTSLNNPNLAGREIKNYKVEAFGKVKNDVKDKEELFDNYIRVYTASGASLNISGTKVKCEVDEKYEISELYILLVVEFTNGTSETAKYKVDLLK